MQDEGHVKRTRGGARAAVRAATVRRCSVQGCRRNAIGGALLMYNSTTQQAKTKTGLCQAGRVPWHSHGGWGDVVAAGWWGAVCLLVLLRAPWLFVWPGCLIGCQVGAEMGRVGW